MNDKIRAFARHLESEGYGFISLPNGVKLRNTHTGADHSLESLAPKYVRWTHGEVWNLTYINQLYQLLPFIESIVFDPAVPQGFNGNTINTYRTFTPARAASADLTLWHEYTERLYSDEADRRAVFSWLAHIFQHPEQRPTWHIVSPSDTGTGKGFLFQQVLSPLLADQTKHYSSYTQLTEKHNESLSNNLIIVFDDPPQASKRVAESLKSMQTEPTVDIRPLYEGARKVRTYSRFITFSNNDHPIDVEANDRRHYVTRKMQHRIDGDETATFIAQLACWLEAGGLEAVHRWFMEYDLSQFNPYRPPFSAELENLKQASISPAHHEAEAFTEDRKVFSFDVFRDSCPAFSRQNEASEWLKEHGYTADRLFRNGPHKNVPNITKGALWYPASWTKEQASEWYLAHVHHMNIAA